MFIRYNKKYFYVLDIETGTANIDLGNDKDYIPCLTWLCYGYINKYSVEGKRVKSLFFRTWDELKTKLDAIEKEEEKSVLCFVHNLSFEGDFLIKNVSPAEDFCSNSNHGFISLKLKDYKKTEFRCSYALSGVSLRELGKMVNLPKLEDDYYSYLPSDEIPEESKRYCKRDCDIVAKYVYKLLDEYGSLIDIPYTKTGRVRKKLQQFYSKSENKDTLWDINPDEDVYDLINDSFMGGITTSNPRYTGLELKKVHSYDISSSYPFVMLSEFFPYYMKKADCKTISELKEHSHFIARIAFDTINSKYEWGWVAASRFSRYDAEPIKTRLWNGKVLSMNCGVITLNDVDLENFISCYTFEGYKILDCCVCDGSSKLPKCYIDTIKFYAGAKFRSKKRYKENPTYENYLTMCLAKQDFNSIYGMCVQKICPTKYEIDDFGIWKEIDLPYKKTKKHQKRSFLFGTYITAYARRNLLKAITTNCECNFVYCDTDSIKFVGKNEFVDTNGILKEYEDDEELYGLGRFEYEGYYQQFITFGAKKYAYKKNGKTDFVVAGLPKGSGRKMEQFKTGTLFEECKNAHIYINDKYDYIKYTEDGECETTQELSKDIVMLKNRYKEENGIKTEGGIAIYPVSYLLDMTEDDKQYLKSYYNREVL